jgi:hypothetical protein
MKRLSYIIVQWELQNNDSGLYLLIVIDSVASYVII